MIQKMNSLQDCFTLSNGVQIPCIGFGTWQTPEGKVAEDAVKMALAAGYMHIDTAAFYGNEKSVGVAVRESGIPREDIFVTSKVWKKDRGYEATKAAFEVTMEQLGLDYLDLYLIHWPAVAKQCDDWEEINSSTWRALEELYMAGRIKAIGVSNFLPYHLDALMKTATIKPMVNQIECHPGFTQRDSVAYCQANDIQVEAWSPLGNGKVLANETLVALAIKYDRTVAQLCIRWELQQGILPLPKSVTESRIIENAKVFDFEISEEDMNKIDAIPFCGGAGVNPDDVAY